MRVDRSVDTLSYLNNNSIFLDLLFMPSKPEYFMTTYCGNSALVVFVAS
jgi:hypothetical protein